MLSARRLDLVRCPCGYSLADGPALAVGEKPVEMGRHISAWLAGATFSTVGLPTARGFWWLDRLRSAILRAPPWLARVRREWAIPTEDGDESLAWLAAADLILDWPQAFESFLDVYQTVDKHLSCSTGVGRSFGLLLRDADRLERVGHSSPAEMLRNYLLTKYRRGHVTRKVNLFRAAKHRRRLQERPWLTQTDAARRLGVRSPTIAALVRRGALSGEIHVAGRKGRTVGVVTKESVERLKGRFADSSSVAATAERLGVERHRVLDLIQARILGDAIRTARGWRIATACIEELLQSVRRLPLVSSKPSDWVALREATRRFGGRLNLVRIVGAVSTGSMPAYRDPRDGSLSGLRFNVADLRRFTAARRESDDAERGYFLNRLAAILIPDRPLKEIVLRKWIGAGLLHAQRLDHGRHVSVAEVDRFRATYCLAPEACRLLEVTRSTLARYEAEGRVAAVYSRRTHSGAGASLFLRSDIERLAAARAA